MRSGYDSVYLNQFKKKVSDVKFMNKDEKNKLESSHWDHSRSWSQNFRTEQLQKFKGNANHGAFADNKHFGYQNTLNQIGTHYKLGFNPTNFESTATHSFRDNS